MGREKEKLYMLVTRRGSHCDPPIEHAHSGGPKDGTAKHQHEDSGGFIGLDLGTGSENGIGKKTVTFAPCTPLSPTAPQLSPAKHPHALTTPSSNADTERETARLRHRLTPRADHHVQRGRSSPPRRKKGTLENPRPEGR